MLKSLCAILLATSLTTHYSYQAVVNDRVLSGDQIPSEFLGHLMGPWVTFGHGLKGGLQSEAASERLVELGSETYHYWLGHFLIYLILAGLADRFFLIDFGAYESASGERMNPNPEKVLYLDGIPHGDRLGGFPWYDFSSRYGEHPNAVYRTFDGIEELVEVLRSVEREGPFDRIEVFAHGVPEVMSGRDEKKIRIEDLDRLAEAGLSIASPGADLRFIVCSLGGGKPFQKGDSPFLRRFGEILLGKGGRVLAPSRSIVALRKMFRSADWDWANPPSALREQILVLATGFGNYHMLGIEILPRIWRSYRASRNDFVEVEVSVGE